MKGKKYALTEAVQGSDIKTVRKKLKLTQNEFSALLNVSVKTIERWESGKKEITGPVVTLLKLLDFDMSLAKKLEVPKKKLPLRLWYYYKNQVCSIIDVDERRQIVEVFHYTNDSMMKAFGKNTEVTYEMYEEFLESRCFPKERDKMKLKLKELDIPFYDPLMIIEKTEGRMAEDEFWVKIER